MPQADAARIAPMLRVADITAAYGRETVLREVSLEMRGGEIVAISGPNGSGKSSLLKVILGHLPAREGEVTWFGRPMRGWTRRELARRVAYLPQAPTGVPGQRVADVLASGRAPYWGLFGVESAQDRHAVEEAAELLGLTDWLGRDVATLSGGQRQRVFIGRCVAQTLGSGMESGSRDGRVGDGGGGGGGGAILLDEPDTYLDLRHLAELSVILKRLARERGLGILLASHDLNLAAGLADRMLLLAGGQVVAAGAAREVMRPEVVQTVYGVRVTAVVAGERTVLVPD